jgi:cytochrome c oxidase assembly protein Cox11
MQSRRRKNLQVVVPCVAVIVIMLGLVAFSPILFRLFNNMLGISPTTQMVNSDAAAAKRTP